MAGPRVLIFGDSHVHAIQEAARHRAAKGRETASDIRRLLKVKNDKTIGDTEFEDFLAQVGELTSHDVVVSLIGGNQHAVFSTIQHPVPFDFFLPGEDSAPSAGTIIPFRVLKEAFSVGIRNGDGRSLEAIRKSTNARMVHLLAPPPKGDNSFIENYHDTRFAAANIEARGVSPAPLRMKFWQLQNLVVEEICRELGIEVLPPPRSTLDENGFLLREYYANDATHANAGYGEAVLRDIEERFHPAAAEGSSA
ncbi:MAG TPA: hypothetical protein VIL42_03945 [Sphingomicrobium sp.]